MEVGDPFCKSTPLGLVELVGAVIALPGPVILNECFRTVFLSNDLTLVVLQVTAIQARRFNPQRLTGK